MSGYDGVAADFYDKVYGGDSELMARRILEFYGPRRLAADDLIVDVCCGPGRLVSVFSRAGFRVIGGDLSRDIVTCAKRTVQSRGDADRARVGLVQCDASRLPIGREVAGLVTCCTDSLNHLTENGAVQKFVGCAASILRKGGWAVVDVLTRQNMLSRNVVNINIDDTSAVIIREMYDDSVGFCLSRITAFNLGEGGVYHRLETGAARLLVDPQDLVRGFLEAGFDYVFLSHPESLGVPIEVSDTGLERIVILARR